MDSIDMSKLQNRFLFRTEQKSASHGEVDGKAME
jgi:hypothetical protein